MTVISNNEIARAVYLATKDKSSSEMHQMHEKIINFFVRRKLMSRASVILANLQKIVDQEKGMVRATTSSAHRLQEKEENSLVHFLKKRYSGKEVALNHILDKTLLGGARIEVNDEVIDFSIKNTIKQLKDHLTRSHA